MSLGVTYVTTTHMVQRVLSATAYYKILVSNYLWVSV